jgi:protease I
MAVLSNLRVAIIATDGFEDLELTEPLRALRSAGALVDIISDKEGMIQGYHHQEPTLNVKVDRVLGDTLDADQYDALVLPGGAVSADSLRTDPRVLKFVATMDEEEKPIAAICHAGWILISAGIVSGRKLTSASNIRDDLRNAGAHWVDHEVIVDDNLITSRTPADLADFNREIVELFSRKIPLISPETRHLFARSRIA